jgi:hypothetical protein
VTDYIGYYMAGFLLNKTLEEAKEVALAQLRLVDAPDDIRFWSQVLAQVEVRQQAEDRGRRRR